MLLQGEQVLPPPLLVPEQLCQPGQEEQELPTQGTNREQVLPHEEKILPYGEQVLLQGEQVLYREKK